MDPLWRWKGISAGFILAALSLLVAHEYLRLMPARRPPGLHLGEDLPPSPPSLYAVKVARAYLVMAALGFLLAVWSAARL